jgi:hypothetical protein
VKQGQFVFWLFSSWDEGTMVLQNVSKYWPNTQSHPRNYWPNNTQSHPSNYWPNNTQSHPSNYWPDNTVSYPRTTCLMTYCHIPGTCALKVSSQNYLPHDSVTCQELLAQWHSVTFQ